MIEFHHADIDYSLNNTDEVINWLNGVASAHNHTISQLNYIFCSDSYLRNINREYLNHDYFTDIITFPLSNEYGIEADIYISIDRIRENASVYGQEESTELRRVLVHGLLHLLGFDDHTKKDKQEMRKEEDHWLKGYT